MLFRALLLCAISAARGSEEAASGDGDGVDSWDANDWDTYSYAYYDYAEDTCAFHCPTSYLGDGECDADCNNPACEWDKSDCFHGYGDCYTQADGSDYRGAINQTEDGLACQAWSDQMPQRHDRIHLNYPHGGLGGHNSCRNPDGEARPWCYTTDPDTRWAYCAVPPPEPSCSAHHHSNHSTADRTHVAEGTVNATGEGDGEYTASYGEIWNGFDEDYYDYFPPVSFEDTSTAIELDTIVTGEVKEHTYTFYEVSVPKDVERLRVVVVPTSGDPDLYVSFDNAFPTGGNYTFLSDSYGVEEWTLGRDTYLFCGAAGPEAACTLHLSVLAYDEDSSFSIIVYGEGADGELQPTVCAEGCAWTSLGDGTCDEECNVEACYFDRGDCKAWSEEGAAPVNICPADCKPEWIGDHYCDEACFRESCQWDKHDCLKKDETPCADFCLPTSIGDGECDAACNVEACGFDAADCFHEHTECYESPDGADYRGTLWFTTSGLACQFWSDQSPQQHTRTAQHYPVSGLGGHNYCRNPDREAHPWCYVADADAGVRWEYCDVGEVSSTACLHPPPPPPPPAVEGNAAKIEIFGGFLLGLAAILTLLYCRRLQHKKALKTGGFTQYGGHDDGVLGTGVEIKPVEPETA